MRNKKAFLAGILAGALLCLATIWSGMSTVDAADGSPGAPGAAPPPPEVATMVLTTQRVSLTTELPGRTSGYLVSEIRPQVSGLIQKRLFTEGSDVKAGDVLYQIDPAPYQAGYDSAAASLDTAKKTAEQARAAVSASLANVERQKATLALAKTDFQRADDLFKDKAVSAAERDHASTNLDVATATVRAAEAQVTSDRAAIAAADAAINQAQAAVQAAQINLNYTKITAPISGRVGRSSVTDGAIVTAYQPMALATIQALDPIYVDVTQSTAELVRLRNRIEKGALQPGSSEQKNVAIKLENGDAYPHEGVLGFRDVTVDPTTGSVILRITVPNPEGMLLPGMFIRATLEEGVLDQAILVPQQAVSRDPKGNPLVMVVDGEGKVAPKPFTAERAIGDQWIASAGLAVGDHVIVEGLQKARPGTPVKEVPYTPAPPPGAPGAPGPAPEQKSS